MGSLNPHIKINKLLDYSKQVKTKNYKLPKIIIIFNDNVFNRNKYSNLKRYLTNRFNIYKTLNTLWTQFHDGIVSVCFFRYVSKNFRYSHENFRFSQKF